MLSPRNTVNIPDPFDPTPLQPESGEVQTTEKVKGPQPKYKKDDKVTKLIAEMIKAASTCDQLRVQAHLIHFNYEASNFLGVHKFLKKQYEAHSQQFDRLGELVRSMDYLMPMCDKGLRSASKGCEHVGSYEASSMLVTYYTNLESFAMNLKKTRQAALNCDAPDVDNYLAELIGELFKASWMVKSMLR